MYAPHLVPATRVASHPGFPFSSETAQAIARGRELIKHARCGSPLHIPSGDNGDTRARKETRFPSLLPFSPRTSKSSRSLTGEALVVFQGGGEALVVFQGGGVWTGARD